MEYFPKTLILVAVIVFRIAAFENQRWVRARKNGMRGSSETIGFIVDTLLPFGTLMWYLFLAAYAYDSSILNAVILFLIAFASLMVWSLIAKDNIALSIVGSIIMLPIVFYLLSTTTFFGTV